MDFKDYYKVLGLERRPSEDEVRKAYRKLARKYHPDVSKEADAEWRMRDINEANDVLRDKEKRAAYDAAGRPRGARRQPRRRLPAAAGLGRRLRVPPRPGQGPADHAEFSEFFSSLFGAAERARRRRARTTAPAARTITRPSRSRWKTRSTAPSARSRCARRSSTPRARPEVQDPHAEREDPARRASGPVHPARRARHAGPRRRAGRRPVPGGAHRAAHALPHRGPRPLHDAAGHADRRPRSARR